MIIGGGAYHFLQRDARGGAVSTEIALTLLTGCRSSRSLGKKYEILAQKSMKKEDRNQKKMFEEKCIKWGPFQHQWSPQSIERL